LQIRSALAETILEIKGKNKKSFIFPSFIPGQRTDVYFLLHKK